MKPFILSIIALALVILGIMTLNYATCEWKFCQLSLITAEATLLNTEYRPSTFKMHTAPVFGSDGKVSFAFYNTGHVEKYTTLWDCGIYGFIVCDNRDVFRYGKDTSRLLIRHSNYDTRIVGIEK
jgi:hypothetical protein